MSFSSLKKSIIVLLLFCVLSLNAASYYVAISGNDNFNGEQSSPFKTITSAIAKVSAGDTIIITAGTYTCPTTITIGKNGSSDKRFYLIGAKDSRPVLDFSSMSVTSGNQGIKLSGSFWYIKGLIIKGAGDNGILIQGGNNNTIEFCDFLENRDTGCQLKGGAANNHIINCDSYNNRDPDEGDADGFAPKMDVGSGNVFIGCRAWNNSDDGWDGYLRGADNVNTRLENCWCFKNGYRKDGSASSGNGNGFKIGGSDDKKLKHNFTLIRCLAFQNRVKGFDQNNNRGVMTLYNCTAFSNSINYSIDGSSSTLTVKNCIAAGSGSNSLKNGTQSANNFNATSSDFESIDPVSVASPRKDDGSLPDIVFMHLKSNSSMIDMGDVVESVSYNGDKPDIGCFETGILTMIATKMETILSPFKLSSLSMFINDNHQSKRIKLFTINGRKISHTPVFRFLPSGGYLMLINDHTTAFQQRVK